MRNKILLVLALLGILPLSIPASAEHIVEPITPVSEYTMEVYSYPNFSTHLTACDGTEVVRQVNGELAKDIRFETFVDSPARFQGNPSEHWDETVTLFVVRNLGRNNESEQYEWRVHWKHSNVKPHASGGIGDNGPESSQNNQRIDRFPAGTILRFKGNLQTHESLQSFEVECTFRVG